MAARSKTPKKRPKKPSKKVSATSPRRAHSQPHPATASCVSGGVNVTVVVSPPAPLAAPPVAVAAAPPPRRPAGKLMWTLIGTALTALVTQYAPDAVAALLGGFK